MNLLHKLRETGAAVLPICAIVLALGTLVVPLEPAVLAEFCVGSVFVIVGLSLFLTGADLGIVPAGSFIGAKLTRTRSLPLIVGFGLVIGFLITVAEPDLLVLGNQVAAATAPLADTPTIPARALIFAVAAGVGLFVALGLLRTLLQIPYRAVLVIGYIAVFALAARTSQTFVAVAFDSGGATTGPMTVPFIIALGVGISAVRGDKAAEEDSFGYTGIASIGPILAVAVLGVALSGDAYVSGATPLASPGASHAEGTVGLASVSAKGPLALTAFAKAIALVPVEAKKSLTALTPLYGIIVLLQVFLLRLPPVRFRKITIGFCYALIGLSLFFAGADIAFMQAGSALGGALGALEAKWILIPIGCLIGAVVVCAEPAVWVLTEQVEEVSGGNVRKAVLLATLASGVALSVGLSLCRVIFGFSVWYLLAPFYAVAIALTFFSPKLFTAIAFDSGGVASGPMASTFVLSLTLGASEAIGGNSVTDGFGVIAMIAATPLVAIQILGILYRRSEKRASGGIE